MRKFKKLNIAIILMLLVFQTVLSPISVFADDGGSVEELGRAANSDGEELGSDVSTDEKTDEAGAQKNAETIIDGDGP